MFKRDSGSGCDNLDLYDLVFREYKQTGINFASIGAEVYQETERMIIEASRLWRARLKKLSQKLIAEPAL